MSLYRVEQIGEGFAVQRLSKGEFRDQDEWVVVGRIDPVNKCVVFGRVEAAIIAAALNRHDREAASAERLDEEQAEDFALRGLRR